METWIASKLTAMGRLSRSGFSHISMTSDLGRCLTLLERGEIQYELINAYWNESIYVITDYSVFSFDYLYGKQTNIRIKE